MRRKRRRGESDRRSTGEGEVRRRWRSINININISIVLVLIVFCTVAISLYLYHHHHQRIVTKSHPDAAAYQQILTEHAESSSSSTSRNFPNPVLAYITPWNSKGYEMAKDFNSKFTHISPVWYDLKSHGAEFVLEGRHNVDKGWISDLRMRGHALVLPRIVLEAVPMGLLKEKKQRNKVINLIIAECKEMDFDGIVLESWSRWAAYGVLHDPHMRNLALQFIKKLGQAMHSNERSLQLVYVIGPPHSDRLQEYDFGPRDLQSLSDAVDGYSLMTYDFSNPQNPGPNDR